MDEVSGSLPPVGTARAGADAVLIAANAAWGEAALIRMIAGVSDKMGDSVVVGGSVEGVQVGQNWVTKRPALAMLALQGVEAIPLLAEEASAREAEVGLEWAQALPKTRKPGELLIIFADGLSLAAPPLLDGLGACFPDLTTIGMGAIETQGGPALVWSQGRVVEKGCAGIWLGLPRRPEIHLWHGCRPLSGPIEITRARGHWVRGLAGRPALEHLIEHGGDGDSPRGRILVGLRDVKATGRPALEDWLVRDISGIDSDQQAFSVPESLRSGMQLIFLEPPVAETASREGVSEPLPSESDLCRIHLESRVTADFRPRVVPDGGPTAPPILGISGAYQVASDSEPPGPPRLHTRASVLARLIR